MPIFFPDSKSRRPAAVKVFTPLGYKTIRWAAPVKARPVCGPAGSRAIATQSPGLDGRRTADYPLSQRGNTLYKSGKRSVNGGVLGVSPNKWNFAVKIPYLLGQRHLRLRCPLWQNSAPQSVRRIDFSSSFHAAVFICQFLIGIKSIYHIRPDCG